LTLRCGRRQSSVQGVGS